MGTGTLTDSLSETLALFDGSGEPRTTTELAEELDLGRRSTYDRLERLVEQDRLRTKKAGANARVWWRPRQSNVAEDTDWPLAAESLIDDVFEDVAVAAFVLDANFDVAWMNGTAADYFGLDRSAVLGEDKRRIVDDQIAPAVADGEAFADTVKATYDDNTYTERFECRVEGIGNREPRWLEHRSKPIESGQYSGGRVELYYDVTGRVDAETDRTEDREEFESLVAAVEEYAIFTLDAEGYVKTWNPGARRIKGYEREDIVGEHFSQFYTEEDRKNYVPERNLAMAARDGSVEDEGWRVRADGSTFWGNVTITAIVDDEGDLQGFAKVTKDMTERREYERQLRQERDFTDQILQTTPASIFVLDRDGDVLLGNDRFKRELGLEDTSVPSVDDLTMYDEAGDVVPPAERPYHTVFESGEAISDWRCEIEQPDGQRRWMTINVAPIDEEGVDVDRVVVAAQDVTHLYRQERRLERQRDELRAELDDVFTRIDDAFFALDTDWRFVHVNERAEEVLDRSAEKLIGRNVWEEFPDAVDSTFDEQYREAMDTLESVTFEEYYPPLDAWLQVTAYPSEEGLSVYFTDVTDRVQREQVLERYETVVETVEDGVYVVDEDGYFTMVNDAYAEMAGRAPEELLGSHVETVIDDEAVLERAREIERDLLAGEGSSRTIEAELGTRDGEPVIGEATFAILGDESSYERVGVVRDVTERKRRERELELYGTLFEESRDVNALLDETGAFEYVTPSVATVLGYKPAELVGENAFEYVHPDDREFAWETFAAMVEDPDREPTIDLRFERAEGGWAVMEVRARNLVDDETIGGVVAYTRDVTARRQREHELELYETIVSAANDGIYVLNEDFEFTRVNDAYVEMTGYDRDELLGAHCSLVVEDEVWEKSAEQLAEILSGDVSNATLEGDIQRADGSTLRAESNFTGITRPETGETHKVGVVRDVSERVERERKLERRVRQQTVVTELGRRALEERDLDALMAEAAERVAKTLDNDYCKVLDLNPDAEELLLRQGVGWDDGIVGEATISSVEDESQAAYTLSVDEPVNVTDLSTETRFSGPDLLRDHDVKSGISTIIGPHDEPWGILGTHDTEVRTFDEQDLNFVQAVANILATAINRHRYERELLDQRERLAALNQLNGVVREVTDAVIEQSTREEIEQTACDRLADSQSYAFAWIGEADETTKTIELRTEAGVEGYLDDITVSIDPEDEYGDGPTARALRTGEIQVTNDVVAADVHDPWRDHVEHHGFRSSAAIPIVHEGTVYGVLNVYATRRSAFTGEERTVIEQLGEIIGHAIAAVERKRALMSDEMVELVFEIEDVFETLGIEATDAPIRLDHTVEIGDDEYILYGSTTPAGVEAVESMVAAIDFYEDVTIREGSDEVNFELRVSEPPILSTVATLGGTVEDAVIEDGDYWLTLHMSPSADVRTMIDEVLEAYPSAYLLKRRQVTKETPDVDPRQTFLTDLTDRQRATIEAAYHAGFFEWPRAASGEDVADSLGVASPTFHQHLRKAESKVFDAILSSREADLAAVEGD